MPSIIKEDKQVRALQEIEDQLSIVNVLNSLMAEETLYITSGPEGGGKRGAVGVTVKEKEMPKVQAVLDAYRARLCREIRSNAERFRIALDDRDLAILKLESESK